MISSKRAKKRPLEVKEEGSVLQYELGEIEEVLQKLNLTSVILGDYLAFLRSDFDLTIAEEPYIAVMLLFDRSSGRFLARIWNKTVAVGKAVTKKELSSVLSDIFDGGRPCIGIPQDEELPQIEPNSQFLVKTSKSCHLLLGKDADPDAVSCQECLKLSCSVETPTPDVKCKVEIKETGDADSFLDQKETHGSFENEDQGFDDADYDVNEDLGPQEEESEWEEDRDEIEKEPEKEPRNKSDKRSCKFGKKSKSLIQIKMT